MAKKKSKKAARQRLLSSEEEQLVQETADRRLNELNEDELVQLHSRVRRSRNKYSKQYRRLAREQVQTDRARGKASKKHVNAAQKAEVFEDALAQVSRRLAIVAAQAADILRAERRELLDTQLSQSDNGKKKKKSNKAKTNKKKKSEKGSKNQVRAKK